MQCLSLMIRPTLWLSPYAMQILRVGARALDVYKRQVIDGTDLPASGARAVIKKVCSERSIEYHRIAAKQQMNLHTSVYRNKDQLLRDLEYPVGNILVEGDEELYGLLTGVKDFSEKIIMMAPADPDVIKRVLDLGYSCLLYTSRCV